MIRKLGCGCVSLIALLFVIAAIGSAVGGGKKSVGSERASTTSRPRATSKPQPPATATQVPATSVPAPHYDIAMSGGMPSNQYVGVPITLRIHIRNKGSDIPNLSLWFQGLGSWVIVNEFTGCLGVGSTPVSLETLGDGNAWDFGSVPAGTKCDAVLYLNPKTAGNPTLSVSTYANVDKSTGSVDANTGIDSGSGQWQVAINP